VKHAWLVLAVGCWSAPAATPRAKPEPVTPPVDPRAGAQIVDAEPLDVVPDGSPFHMEQELDARAPWTFIATGRSSGIPKLAIIVDGKSHLAELASDADGVLTPTFELRDIVPGGAPEILVVVESVVDGGKWVSVVVCGLGPSRVPSCATTSIGKTMFDLNDESYKVVTPRSGGVELRWEDKHQKLWFEFP
jgi:hypothetical protein